MRRQCFVALGLALGVLAAPLIANAQGTRKVPRVGIVFATSPSVGRPNVDATFELVINMRTAKAFGRPDGLAVDPHTSR